MSNDGSNLWERIKALPPRLHLAIVAFVAHMIFGGGIGYHHDELYFVATGRRWEFGYVDNPPLVPWIGALSDWLFGGSLRRMALSSLRSSKPSRSSRRVVFRVKR